MKFRNSFRIHLEQKRGQHPSGHLHFTHLPLILCHCSNLVFFKSCMSSVVTYGTWNNIVLGVFTQSTHFISDLTHLMSIFLEVSSCLSSLIMSSLSFPAFPLAGRGNLRPQLDSAMQDVSDLYLLMEETEKQAVRRALLEERSHYCTFINLLQPVLVRNVGGLDTCELN